MSKAGDETRQPKSLHVSRYPVYQNPLQVAYVHSINCIASKEDLRKRLEWILDARQGTNPSRLVLKAVNEYLISAKYK